MRLPGMAAAHGWQRRTSSLANEMPDNDRPLTVGRAEILHAIRRAARTTLCIAGAGVQGAALARLAAANGIACLLVDAGDFGGETSSRSSRMAHGGLRYLDPPLFDIRQVREGLRSRQALYEIAGHLCRPAPFWIPCSRGDIGFRWKLAAGLTLYDLLAGTALAAGAAGAAGGRHAFHRAGEVPLREAIGLRADTRVNGYFEYWDGLILDDSRLTLEFVLDARRLGAACLNYVEAVSVAKSGDGFVAGLRDRTSGEELEVRCDLLVDCTGPWAGRLEGQISGAPAAGLRWSQGTHLLFSKPHIGPCLFLPMGERSRYYFLWPFQGGAATMAGTTERELTDVPGPDPMPREDEVSEILGRLERDVPGAGLDRSSLIYAFAGVRALPVRGRGGIALASRRHAWTLGPAGVLTLRGGKLTSAPATAWEGFLRAAEILRLAGKWTDLRGRRLPGGASSEELAQIRARLEERGAPPQEAAHLAARYGRRAAYLLGADDRLDRIAPGLYRGQVLLAAEEEGAIRIEDVLRRRTGFEHLHAAHMDAALPAVAAILHGGSDTAAEAEIAAIRARLDRLRALLGQPGRM